jgi:hypothetical protein
MADANELPARKSPIARSSTTFDLSRELSQHVSYFLRVPDGNADGAGYPETRNESLRRLAEGRRSKLRAIDGSSVYRGLERSHRHPASLIDYERADAPVVQINVGETDR